MSKQQKQNLVKQFFGRHYSREQFSWEGIFLEGIFPDTLFQSSVVHSTFEIISTAHNYQYYFYCCLSFIFLVDFKFCIFSMILNICIELKGRIHFLPSSLVNVVVEKNNDWIYHIPK